MTVIGWPCTYYRERLMLVVNLKDIDRALRITDMNLDTLKENC